MNEAIPSLQEIDILPNIIDRALQAQPHEESESCDSWCGEAKHQHCSSTQAAANTAASSPLMSQSQTAETFAIAWHPRLLSRHPVCKACLHLCQESPWTVLYQARKAHLLESPIDIHKLVCTSIRASPWIVHSWASQGITIRVSQLTLTKAHPPAPPLGLLHSWARQSALPVHCHLTK